MSRRGGRLTASTRGLLLGLALLAAAGCRPAGPEAALPDGTLLAGRGAGLRALLARLEPLAGTPLGEAARLAAERIAGCDRVAAACPAGEACELLARLGCAEAPEPEAVRRLRGDADWLWAGKRGAASWTARGWSRADGGQEVEVSLAVPAERTALSLLLPGAADPGPARLAGREALVHLRLRPDGGLDVASLMPAEGAAARLFRLRNELFLATALAGTWELAVYAPAEGELIPPAALALDFRSRERAVTAIESFLAEVMATWPVRRSPWRLGEWEGACLSNLNVLPELAPCYLATGDALVVGWNARSLERGLGAPPGPPPPAAGAGGWLRVDFERLPAADAVLARASGAGPEAAPPAYPWRGARLTGRRDGDRYRLRLELEP